MLPVSVRHEQLTLQEMWRISVSVAQLGMHQHQQSLLPHGSSSRLFKHPRIQKGLASLQSAQGEAGCAWGDCVWGGCV